MDACQDCADAELAKRDTEIASLRMLLWDCLDCLEEEPDRPIAVAIKEALEAK
jgi:hypothetical protein